MQSRPRRPGPPLRVDPIPGFASPIDDQGIARLELHALRLGNILQLPAVNRLFLSHERLATETWDIEQHPTRDDAGGPVGDRAKPRTVEADLVFRVSAIPHAVVVPHVAERVQVGCGLPVVRDAVEVDGPATAATVYQAHEVLRRIQVVRRRVIGELSAEGDRPAAAHQRSRPYAFFSSDQANGADLVVRSPAAPVTSVTQVALYFALGRDWPLRQQSSTIHQSPIAGESSDVPASSGASPGSSAGFYSGVAVGNGRGVSIGIGVAAGTGVAGT